jgi:hypothetical protein
MPSESPEDQLAAMGFIAAYEPREQWVRCRLYRYPMEPLPALLYWAPGSKAFTCVSGTEQSARLIGYKVAEWAEWPVGAIGWCGTIQLPDSSWVAQFIYQPTEEDE